jgi:hypothetical protein
MLRVVNVQPYCPGDASEQKRALGHHTYKILTRLIDDMGTCNGYIKVISSKLDPVVALLSRNQLSSQKFV